MAGHNKWSKVKHRKAVVDKRRSKAWSMCSRAIISAARQGGPDPQFNFLLRHAIDDARYHNMPNDNIDRAIKKGAGGGETENYEPVRYEGYGPGGVAVLVDAFTNNRTRTAANVRLIFTNHDARMGVSGTVAHQFEHKGRLSVLAPLGDEDKVIEAALNAGADDARRDDSGDEPGFEVLCDAAQLHAVKAGLAAAGLKLGECGHEMIPSTLVSLDAATAKAFLEFVEALEDDEDVKKVSSNADIADDVLAALGE